MLRRFWNRISSFPLWQRMRTGRTPYIITTAALLISTLLVYFDPRSVLAFLLFMASVSLIYVMPLNRGFRIGAGLIVALILIPVIGLRNIFYLEVIFQISVFAALALGLNIVVGFTGLLNLGYVAFYAVGAYLWAFFGSQQIYLLHAIPGSAPPNSNFFLPADTFYLFLFLGLVIAAVLIAQATRQPEPEAIAVEMTP